MSNRPRALDFWASSAVVLYLCIIYRVSKLLIFGGFGWDKVSVGFLGVCSHLGYYDVMYPLSVSLCFIVISAVGVTSSISMLQGSFSIIRVYHFIQFLHCFTFGYLSQLINTFVFLLLCVIFISIIIAHCYIFNCYHMVVFILIHIHTQKH